MQLDKENIKKIRWLIAFAILLYLGVQNLHIVISTVRVLLGFLFPFIIGFGIAFILNIPMKFIEHHLFDNVFGNNPEVVKWAQSLDIEPGKIIDSVLGVLKNGVNNIVSSTVSITMGLLTTAMNVSIGFVFACYVLLQKEKLLQQIKKAMYAILPDSVSKL